MKPIQIKDVVSYKQTGRAEEGELMGVLQEHIGGKAYVYTAMDHAVALGLYENKNIQIGLGLERKITNLPLPYVQELRVFNEKREFRALRINGSFRWRLRVDQGTEPESCRISTLDETHKLWGSVQKETDRGKWSLLSAKRGSAIFFPEEIALHGEKGLLARNYIQFNTADDENGLVHFVDERLCGFVDWPEPKEEVERHDGKE